MFSFDFNTSTMIKIGVIFIVIVLHGSVIVYCSTRKSVRMKQLRECLIFKIGQTVAKKLHTDC